jgi:hypothetical protein
MQGVRRRFRAIASMLMRDDFSSATKELLAKRAGFRCSNPGCRQPTSGPQADPKGSINIGVAAHITAASTDGARYDHTLTAEPRSAAENGIWLCQSCAKLVDNDAVRYTVQSLRDWKARAEATAASELERRLSRHPDSATEFERMKRLMPALLAEMRKDLAEHPPARELVLLQRAWRYWPAGNEFAYYYDDHPDLDNKLRILENERLVQNASNANLGRYVISERLAEYLGAP